MNWDKTHNIYFIGIGGIGMSALARYFHGIGKNVAGYDRTSTPLTEALQQEGITVHFNYDRDVVNSIPNTFKNVEDTLVIYTPAVPSTNTVLCYFTDHNFVVRKRSAVLGSLANDHFCFAVAGTHGKTTTAAILAHLLKESGKKITAFIGGVLEDHNTNLIMEGNEACVVEADEFDRSFLQLHPQVACITSMDADHLDIYGQEASLRDAFLQFAAKVDGQGKLFVREGLPVEGISFGIDEDADFDVQQLRVEGGAYRFNIKTPTGTFGEFRFSQPGHHNIRNAVAALAMASTLHVPWEALKEALASFKGVQRRFSYAFVSEARVLIDDYAHHPKEIDAVHQAVMEFYPDKRHHAIFQPHLYSRTRDFAEEFAVSLGKFHQISLLDIYPARERPLPGIDSEWLLEKIDNPAKRLIQKEQLTEEVLRSGAQVVLTLGAGDIGEEVIKIREALARAN